MKPCPIQGVGLGLRFEHFDAILERRPSTPWFEVMVEDFLNEGPHHKKLYELRRNYPIVFHSIGLNLGGVDPFNIAYLTSVKNLYEKFRPVWISDHLCWSAHQGSYHHDLLPIPRTKEGLQNVCQRICFLQDFFKKQLLLENITAYINYEIEDYGEIDFIKEVVRETGCALLLDITNAIINHKNNNLNYHNFFDNFPMEYVKQIHLAGGSEESSPIIDTHSSKVGDADIAVLAQLYSKGFAIPALLERDANIPEFGKMEKERKKIELSLK